MSDTPHSASRLARRTFVAGLLPGAAALACGAAPARQDRPGSTPASARRGHPVLVGSANALPGMLARYPELLAGAAPLDVAIEVVKLVEADPNDHSVGLGGLPNEDGVVQLDAAVMHGPTHNSGAVAAIENILHPSEVARLVMERTDHCLIVGRGAYEFARAHGFPHVDLLTEESRREWMRWKESMSEQDDRLPPRADAAPRVGAAQSSRPPRPTGTIHCSALSQDGELACTTTTSGLAFKIPGRVGDSPIVGAGLYCDQEAGSAGATGRGEASVLAGGSLAILEAMRRGASPLDAGLEILQRVVRQTQRQARWQPALLDERGRPTFGLNFYVLGLDGSTAGVTLAGEGKYAVADPVRGPRLETLTPLFG